MSLTVCHISRAATTWHLAACITRLPRSLREQPRGGAAAAAGHHAQWHPDTALWHPWHGERVLDDAADAAVL